MDVTAADRPHACDLCNKRFKRKYDLKRHVQNVHDQNEYDPDKDAVEESKVDDSESEESETDTSIEESEQTEDESDNSQSDSEESDSEENESSDVEMDLEDNETYQAWYEEATQATQEMRTEKFEKYISQGMDEDAAKEKAYIKTLWAVKKVFFKCYEEFLKPYIFLKDDDTHQDIIDDLEKKLNMGANANTALRRVMVKHRTRFDGLFLQDDDTDDEDMEVFEDDDS